MENYTHFNDKKSIKDTLSLPKTKFPMKPNNENLVGLEKKINSFWKEINIYSKTRRNKPSKYLHFGPPYANNNLHIGHSANMILKDIVVRWWNICGYNSYSRAGFDCHGLPIEINVQKKQKQQLSVDQFRLACKQEALFWLQKQKETINKLGLLIHPDHYSTMDNFIEIYKVFSKILLKNKVFCAHKILPWSIVEKTVISDAEIEYRDKMSTSVYVKLKIQNSNCDHMVIWTTTPWSLLDNTAVAINKKLTYVKVPYNGSNLIVVEENLQKLQHILDTSLQSTNPININQLIGMQCEHPIRNNHYVPIVHSDHVTHEDGTGVVHIAPAHGVDDFNLYERGLVDIVDEIDDSGYFKTDVSQLNGLHIFHNSLEKILELLNKKLIAKENINHRYPFASRSLEKNTPLIFKATKQIFFDIKSIKNSNYLADVLKDSTFYPNNLKESLIKLISSRSEWCVSRQRFWGVPLCIFLNKKTNKILINEKLQKKIIDQLQIDPNYFFNQESINILDGIENKNDYYPYIGVLDVWFDSGCSFDFVAKKLESLDISDVYLEGKDQIRGWFQSSLLTSLLLNNKPPYKDVISHGFIVDEKGYKISKSLGNGVPLENILNEYGTEILRLWIVYIDFSAATMKLGPKLLDDTRLKYRKIRNVMRYLIGVVEQINYQSKISYVNDTIDIAMLEELRKVYNEYKLLMNQYEINKAFTRIFNYINYISSFYFNVKKDILYCDLNHSPRKKSVQKTCKIILISLMILLAPILPFTMEEIFLHTHLFQQESVHMLDTSIIDSLLHGFQGDSNITLIENIQNDLKDIRIEMEKMIQDKIINQSLQTEIHCNLPYDLELIGQISMVSKVVKSDENFILKISDSKECIRCHIKGDKDMCNRCTQVMKNI